MTVLLVCALHGRSGRVFAREKADFIINSPDQAFLSWQESKVKGRILLLFDNYPHLRGLFSYEGAPQLSGTNLVEFSIFNNIIRKIYLIVPDNRWDEFQQQKTIRPLRKVPGIEKAFYLGSLSGILMIAVTPSSLPHLEERPLVYINSVVFDDAEVRTLLSGKNISTDIIVTLRGGMQ